MDSNSLNIKEVSKLLEDMKGMKEILDKEIKLLEDNDPDTLIKLLNTLVNNLKTKKCPKSKRDKEIKDLVNRFQEFYFDMEYDDENQCYKLID